MPLAASLSASLSGLRARLGQDQGRRLVTAALVLLALASALAWALALRRLSLPAWPPAAAPAAATLPEPALLTAAELARLLGEPAAASSEPAPARRFVVLGVIARPSGGGAALMAVDGAPARPFAVGAEIAPGFVLKRLGPREVVLAESMNGPVKLVLPLPAWEPAGSASGAPPSSLQEPSESAPAQPQRRGDQTGP